jgi:hypothetical protein
MERENALAPLHSTRYFTICLNGEYTKAVLITPRAGIKKVRHRDVLCWITGQINDTVNSFSSYSHSLHGLLLPYYCIVNRYPINIFPTLFCRYVLLSALSAIRGEVNWWAPESCLQAIKDINEISLILYFNISFLPALSA